MDRRLDADEAALWARVMAEVRPIRPVPVAPKDPSRPPEAPRRSVASAIAPLRPTPNSRPNPPGRLDGGWDRRIGRGAVDPDATIDLHGHTLRSAHALLDRGIERALASGHRVILLITGKPPRLESERPHTRGAIRAAITDWIAASRHAGAIAAVRVAHPRHGGTGALYLILRRPRVESIRR